MDYRFTIRRDFDLGASVTCGQVFRWRAVDSCTWAGVTGNQAYWVTERGDKYEVASNHDEGAFRRLFRLDHDWSGLIKRIESAGIASADPWIRTMDSPSPVETLFSFMCTANNNLARIQPMVEVLGRHGEPVWEHQGTTFCSFPDVDTVSQISIDSMVRSGFGYRARQIAAAALTLRELGGEKFLEGLKKTDRQEATAQLCRLTGVGQKVADCTTLHGLGQTSAVPVDTHIWRFAVEKWFPKWRGQSMTAGRYQAVGDMFRELFGTEAGLAQQLVFHGALRAKVG
ncbi:MAG: hypothetical protein JSS65_09640 [Armatimonadetes bacterium]|nr:hypothetical protein [Armatimonadota bacterium]